MSNIITRTGIYIRSSSNNLSNNSNEKWLLTLDPWISVVGTEVGTLPDSRFKATTAAAETGLPTGIVCADMCVHKATCVMTTHPRQPSCHPASRMPSYAGFVLHPACACAFFLCLFPVPGLLPGRRIAHCGIGYLCKLRNQTHTKGNSLFLH